MKQLSALLAMTVAASAVPADPGVTALMFLEKVRAKNVNLEPGADTAISAQTSAKKRREIARRLDRMADDLGGAPLELGKVKQEDDLAAVLVRRVGGFDPSRLQVFPVALVKRGDGWAAAPMPASFENTNARFSPPLRERVESLEEWMLRERVIDLEKLRQQSEDRMRRKISEALPAATLAGFSAAQVWERFLRACETRKTLEVLALLGGLSAELPDDWALRVKSAENSLQGDPDGSRIWRLLTAPEVLRLPVYQEEDGDTALVSIGCLDPRQDTDRPQLPKLEILHLNLSKTREGLWRIDPPREEADPGDGDPFSDPDADLLEMFPAKLAVKFPSAPSNTAELARDALLSALASPVPTAWVPLVHGHGDPKEIIHTHAIAAQIWWELRNPASNGQAIPLAFHEDSEHAVAACHFFDVRNTDQLKLRYLFFTKTPAGWLWEPSPSAETRKAFQQWTDSQNNTMPESWQDALLANCQKIDRIPPTGAPGEGEARQLVVSWLDAMKSGDVEAALRLTARLGTDDSGTRLLRIMGYEIAGARRNPQPAIVTEIHRGEALVAVGTRTTMDDKQVFPLYPIVNTPAGPRILLEIQLIAAGTRGRDFINKSILESLRNFDRKAADELAELFAKHQSAHSPAAKP